MRLTELADRRLWEMTVLSTKRNAVLLALFLVAIPPDLMAGSASTTMAVSATVINTCSISTSSNGGMNPDTGSAVTLTCTKGTTRSVAIGGGSNGSSTAAAPLTGPSRVFTRVSFSNYGEIPRNAIWVDSGEAQSISDIFPKRPRRLIFAADAELPYQSNQPRAEMKNSANVLVATIYF